MSSLQLRALNNRLRELVSVFTLPVELKTRPATEAELVVLTMEAAQKVLEFLEEIHWVEHRRL